MPPRRTPQAPRRTAPADVHDPIAAPVVTALSVTELCAMFGWGRSRSNYKRLVAARMIPGPDLMIGPFSGWLPATAERWGIESGRIVPLPGGTIPRDADGVPITREAPGGGDTATIAAAPRPAWWAEREVTQYWPIGWCAEAMGILQPSLRQVRERGHFMTHDAVIGATSGDGITGWLPDRVRRFAAHTGRAWHPRAA